MSRTVEQKLTDYLVDRGIFPNEAASIMADFKASKLTPGMGGRWNDLAVEYPVELFVTLSVALNSVAVAWIDKNCPQHWARPIFANDSAA